MARGFVYLVAIVDWFTRRALAWRVSILLDAAFCIEALEEALARYGKPTIFNSDQGPQFTSTAFTAVLLREKIAISMDGKGCWRDNVFVERLWRSVKYEEVYINAYASVPEARAGIGARFAGSGSIEVNAPFGLDDLFALRLRPTPSFLTDKLPILIDRVSSKRWLERYPRLSLEATAFRSI